MSAFRHFFLISLCIVAPLHLAAHILRIRQLDGDNKNVLVITESIWGVFYLGMFCGAIFFNRNLQYMEQWSVTHLHLQDQGITFGPKEKARFDVHSIFYDVDHKGRTLQNLTQHMLRLGISVWLITICFLLKDLNRFKLFEAWKRWVHIQNYFLYFNLLPSYAVLIAMAWLALSTSMKSFLIWFEHKTDSRHVSDAWVITPKPDQWYIPDQPPDRENGFNPIVQTFIGHYTQFSDIAGEMSSKIRPHLYSVVMFFFIMWIMGILQLILMLSGIQREVEHGITASASLGLIIMSSSGTYMTLMNLQRIDQARVDFWKRLEKEVKEANRNVQDPNAPDVELQLRELNRCKKYCSEHYPVFMKLGLLSIGRKELRIVGIISALASFISIGAKAYEFLDGQNYV